MKNVHPFRSTKIQDCRVFSYFTTTSLIGKLSYYFFLLLILLENDRKSEATESIIPVTPTTAKEKDGNNKDLQENTTPAAARKRRRKAVPELWKRNIATKLRQTGQEYIGRDNKLHEKKKTKKCDCSKCRLVESWFFSLFFNKRTSLLKIHNFLSINSRFLCHKIL